jgi:hypothetical protein
MGGNAAGAASQGKKASAQFSPCADIAPVVLLSVMELTAYLTKHDGKPRPDGDELIRLSRAVGKSTYYLYLTALGHKRVSADTADALCKASLNGELATVNRPNND